MGQTSEKSQTRKKFKLLTKIFELYQVSRWLDIHKDFK